MNVYRHKVAYYETDKMAVTHHSNYIRWMEEARVDFLDQIGWSFHKLEETGIVSPVISINCNYKRSTVFDDVVEIEASIKSFSGVKLVIEYVMKKAGEDTVVCTGTSEHCFLNAQGRPIRLQSEYPGFYEALMNCVKKD
ncbi:MAG: acyl-CoA thioesterase [Treponema sp.]|nr:acyl-CoA thioesterase [Treponema sp.]